MGNSDLTEVYVVHFKGSGALSNTKWHFWPKELKIRGQTNEEYTNWKSGPYLNIVKYC